MTKARKAALDALDGAPEPLSASGLHERLGSSCDQATVYRALHFLEEKGLAESFVLHCAEHGTERYFVSRNAPHRHWFHCALCHRFLDLGACAIGPMAQRLERERGIRISSHVLYFTGTCPECSRLDP